MELVLLNVRLEFKMTMKVGKFGCQVIDFKLIALKLNNSCFDHLKIIHLSIFKDY